MSGYIWRCGEGTPTLLGPPRCTKRQCTNAEWSLAARISVPTALYGLTVAGLTRLERLICQCDARQRIRIILLLRLLLLLLLVVLLVVGMRMVTMLV